ncbi:hypothetical protein INR49_001600, partial [Caranx melampygus]
MWRKSDCRSATLERGLTSWCRRRAVIGPSLCSYHYCKALWEYPTIQTLTTDLRNVTTCYILFEIDENTAYTQLTFALHVARQRRADCDSSLDTAGKVEKGHRQTLIMAAVHHQGYPLRHSLHWDETDCLNYYGMLSLHEVFEIVGSQLTETDIEVLSFLLNETCSAQHPLDPAGWTIEPLEGEPDDSGVSPSPELLKAWRRLKPVASQTPLVPSYNPKSGLELLLELERRGYLCDGNLEPLLKLLRVLTRHDLLPLVSHKKRRTGIYPPMPAPPARRRKKKRGNGWSRRPKKTCRQVQPLHPPPPPPPQHKVSCDIRLRVRAEYLEHESALRDGVSSDKQQPLERQFELFSQASLLLRARDLGSIVCDIKFTELENLEAFWGDYLSGALLEALKGVFITDSLRMAAGTEGVRLLISVDQDDYEEGRRLLRAKLSSSNGSYRSFWSPHAITTTSTSTITSLHSGSSQPIGSLDASLIYIQVKVSTDGVKDPVAMVTELGQTGGRPVMQRAGEPQAQI